MGRLSQTGAQEPAPRRRKVKKTAPRNPATDLSPDKKPIQQTQQAENTHQGDQRSGFPAFAPVLAGVQGDVANTRPRKALGKGHPAD